MGVNAVSFNPRVIEEGFVVTVPRSEPDCDIYWIFVIFQWSALSFIDKVAYKSVQVVTGVLIIVGVIYPICFIITIIYQRKVKKLNLEQLTVAGVILLIPLLAYIPLVAN